MSISKDVVKDMVIKHYKRQLITNYYYLTFCEFLIARHYSNSQNSMISFEYGDSYPNIFIIENFTTGMSIDYFKNISNVLLNDLPFK